MIPLPPPVPAPLPRVARRAGIALAATFACGLAACAALALTPPVEEGRATVDDMDMGLLQRSLLKLYVCEMESGINAKSLAHYKVAIEAGGDPTKPTLAKMTPEQLEDMRKREKDISHYLLLEKTNAVQMIHIVDKVLGTEAHLAGEGRPERVILEKNVELIEVPRGTEVREAGKIIAEALGCKVRVEVSENEINRIYFTMGPTTGEAIIKQFCSSAPYSWRIENGEVIFRHTSLPSAGGAARPKDSAGDEEK